MLTGWQLIKNEYYYLHDGKMLTGWLNDSNGNTTIWDKEIDGAGRSCDKQIGDGAIYYLLSMILPAWIMYLQFAII